MRPALVALIVLALLGLAAPIGEAQFPGPLVSVHVPRTAPVSTGQVVASITPTSCTIATGATGLCTAMTVTMNPTSPPFIASGSPSPTAMAPLSTGAPDNLGAGAPIVDVLVTMSDASTFSGTCADSDSTYTQVVAAAGKCTLEVRAGSGYGAGDDGTHTFNLSATENGHTLSNQSFSLTISPPVSATFVANLNDVHQTMDGFGASDVGTGFNSSIADEFWCVNATDPGCAQAGIGLTFLRQGSNSNDGGLTQVPFDPSYLSNSQLVVARGGTVWLSEWTASTSDYQTSAQGIINFIQSDYINNGIYLYVVSTQNEPDCGCNGGNGWNAGQTAGFADVLGPMLHGLSPPVKMSSPETAFPQDFNGYVSAIEGDSTANAQVDIFSSHQYGNITDVTNDGTRHVWETEQGDSGGSWDPSIGNAVNQMQTWLYDSIVTVGMSAWHNWNLQCGIPCDYGITAGDTSNLNNVPKRYFGLGNWSKFVRPGWVRVGVTGSSSGFYGVAAFKNPSTGDFAIIAINNSGSDIGGITFGVNGGTISGNVTPWVTSGTAIGALGTDGNLSAGSASSGVPASIVPSNGTFTSTVPYGVTTFVGNVGGVSASPTVMAPLSQTVQDNYAAGATIVDVLVTMSDASTFSGTCADSDSTYTQVVAAAGKCTLKVRAGSGYGAGDDGMHTFNLSATENGHTLGGQSFNLTINPVGSGIACDIGPNYQGSIPAAAQAAGFTECAANWDFTQTASFTDKGGTHQWSNRGSWLDCAGASGTQRLFTNAWNACGRTTIETDYAGKQALHLQLQPSDFPAVNNTVLQTSGTSNDLTAANVISSYPVGKYVEFVEYETSGSPHACDPGSGCGSGIITANWSWPTNNDGIEWDWLEMYTNNSGGSGGDGAQSHNYGSITGIGHSGQNNVWQVSGYDPFHYQTYGVRTATDGAPNGDFAQCIYYDGAIVSSVSQGSQPCSTGSWSPGSTQPNRNVMILTAGPQSGTGSYANIDFWVERETVWECPSSGGSGPYGAGGAGTECNSSQAAVTGSGTLTHGP